MNDRYSQEQANCMSLFPKALLLRFLHLSIEHATRRRLKKQSYHSMSLTFSISPNIQPTFFVFTALFAMHNTSQTIGESIHFYIVARVGKPPLYTQMSYLIFHFAKVLLFSFLISLSFFVFAALFAAVVV
jgi:hypothetical protein